MNVAGAIVTCVAVLAAAPCQAADTYTLIVVGASGGAPYAEKYDGWSRALAATLKAKFGYADDHVVSLEEARREQIQQALHDLRARLTKDDVLFVALIGHGADDRFNLAGPDMSAADWAALLAPIPARVVFADMSSSSFPFMHALAAPGRIVITSNDTAAQQFETVFPEFFIEAFTDPAADRDKDGRVSILEAFQYASAKVGVWFDQHNQLPTERALIDNEGAAAVTYLQPRAVSAGDVPASRQVEIETAIAGLKARRSLLPAAEYDAEMERLLTELARLSAQIRAR